MERGISKPVPGRSSYFESSRRRQSQYVGTRPLGNTLGGTRRRNGANESPLSNEEPEFLVESERSRLIERLSKGNFLQLRWDLRLLGWMEGKTG